MESFFLLFCADIVANFHNYHGYAIRKRSGCHVDTKSAKFPIFRTVSTIKIEKFEQLLLKFYSKRSVFFFSKRNANMENFNKYNFQG